VTVRVYRSTDASAPVLTGSVGTLTALLDAILVNGYGSQAAAGWTIAFTTTNKRAYKQNLTGSNNSSGMFLYVDDTGPGAGGARDARTCGFETMSAITPTGTGQFPTSVQSLIGTGQLVIRKSTTADATARAWTCVANGQTLYLFVESGDSTAPIATTTFAFGDFKSFKANDQYAVMIIGRQLENNGVAQCDPMQALQLSNSPAMQVLNTTMFGHYMARSWTGIGGSQRFGKLAPNFLHVIGASQINNIGPYSGETQTSVSPTNGIGLAPGRNTTVYPWPAPNAPDGSIPVEPFLLCHSFCKRGYLYGLWQTAMDRPFNHGDTWTDTAGNLNGKSFLCQSIQAYINFVQDAGQVYLETSDTWS
jgi:hypothetical protein